MERKKEKNIGKKKYITFNVVRLNKYYKCYRCMY